MMKRLAVSGERLAVSGYTEHRKPNTENRGFTLIEVMIASVLLVSFMGAYLGTYHSFMSSAQQSKALYQALSSSLSKFEEISGHDFSTIVTVYNTTPGNKFDILDNFGNLMGKGIINITYAGSANWTNATLAANWSVRRNHTSLVYNNKMWVMGGWYLGNYFNDVWYSTNGINWTQAKANDTNGWNARRSHTSVVYDNKMWVMGGDDITAGFKNDVWYSVDGTTWYNATSSANWGDRYAHAALVYDNKMWVMGGHNGSASLNDVWYSYNGITWNNATLSAAWPARAYHTSVVYDNKIWVMGGIDFISNNYFNDVWWTNDTNFTDGQTWYNATSSANWEDRYTHTALVYDIKMWVMGGINSTGSFKNDVWYSVNGVNWTNATLSANWFPRWGHTSLVYNNKMWLMGGYNYNDVWWSTGGNRLLDVTIRASFRTLNNRTTGEDENLDGFFNVTSEDKNGNGTYDTPVQLRALVSERKGGTFLGRP